MPSNWKLEALELFYDIRQGAEDFNAFVSRLQAARNALTGAGTGFTINDSIFKNHLLFGCHLRLRRRILAVPGLKYADLKVDAFIGIMSNIWAAMVEEGIVRPTVTAPSGSSALLVPATTPAVRSSVPPLTEAERERLRKVRGCFHCRLDPSSAAWHAHTSRDCPGDPARGIPPRNQPTRVGVVATTDAEDDNEEMMPYSYAVGAINFDDDPPAPTRPLTFRDLEWSDSD